MRVLENILLVLLVKLLAIIENVQLKEVLGCGGFIKSHADIDFTKVEVKLLTKHGALKDKTDCSPSNAYYFLPIYDNGEYVIKIAPPAGWSFEPEEVKINFNGKSDICSLGKDVNFVFKGFGITGKVSLGIGGAKNVEVELKSESGNDIRHTATDANGIFSFTPIIPGKYIIKASHPQWYFEKSQYTVIVEGGNTVLPEGSLVVSGFAVKGHFETYGQLSDGVGIALFKSKSNSVSLRCNKQGLKSDVHNIVLLSYESSPSCFTPVDKNGYYTFNNVAPGKYMMQPVIDNRNLKVNIKPSLIEFEVFKDTLELQQEFKVIGFEISGQVLSGPQGSPIARAVLKLDGLQEVLTDNQGLFILHNVKAGTYKLKVEAEKYEFEDQTVNVQLIAPTMSVIVASAYEVCGKVVAKKSYKVGITKHASTFYTTANTNAETEVWCAYLPSGKYTIEVLTTDNDKLNGIQFFPLQHTIEIKSHPFSDIVFSQLKATLQGKIRCLPDAPAASCLDIKVTLHNLDASGQLTGQKYTTKAKGGIYSFNNVLPGPYEITIPQSNLCFDSTRVLVNIATVSETAPDFVQHGYEVNIISSHRAIIKYSHSSATTTESLKLLSGVNTFCVPKFGSYSIKLEGCHLYNDDELPSTFYSSNINPIIINAKSHKVGIRLLSVDLDSDSIQLSVESDTLGKQIATATPESHKIEGKYVYRFETHLKPEEVLRITPKSDILLFEPTTKNIIGSNDCVDVAFNFVASKGLVVRGKVIPAISDAKITLTFPKNPELTSETTLTNVNGEFKFGPIVENLYYEITGEKETFVFSNYNHSTNSFNAHKLSEIIVKVKDETGKELNNVLVSLSGSESYRKNLITLDDGSIGFHSLSPSQYFLRPMLKEFKFEPNSKIIDLKDGETVEILMVGKRVAYSAYGTVTSLNGEPFSAVNIEATATENCSHHQEEAITENNGKYRLRGLNPNCDYTVRVKDAGEPGSNVHRSVPMQRIIKIDNHDVHNINFLAISPFNFVDVTARVTASSNDFYKTLRLIMYRKGSYDSPIYSQRVETPLNPKSRYNPGIMIFLPRIPLDGKTYVLELRSSLSDKTYTYNVPSEQFVADTGSVFVELDFTPEVKSYESDVNQNSISALILLALISIAFFKQDIAVGLLNFVWSKINAIADDLAQKQKNSLKNNIRKVEPINQKEIEQMAEQINNIKKKKTKKIY